jgi:hypothetical protein
VTALGIPVQDLPLGFLRSHLIVAALDSLDARQVVNEMAWRLGVPWIDTGVAVVGPSLLARVTVYVPGEDRPCLECAWGDREYAALSQSFPCTAEDSGPSPARGRENPPQSGSPAALGALAAALAAIECERILRGDLAAAGRQIVFDAAHATSVVTVFRWNERCLRSADHREWRIQPLARGPAMLTLKELLEMSMAAGAGAAPGEGASRTLAVAGRRFLLRLACPQCGRTRRCLQLDGNRSRRCRECSRRLVAAGFDLADCVSELDVRPRDYRRSLATLGIRAGDVLSLGGPHGELHLEVSCPRGACDA